MGIETSAEHGGSEMSFMAAVIAVEGTSHHVLGKVYEIVLTDRLAS